MIKIFRVLSILICVALISTGCVSNRINEDDASKEMGELIIEYLNNEDLDGLKSLFSLNTTNSHDLDAEIKEVFEFIDGSIISYDDFSTGSSSESVRDGRQVLLTASPKIKGVKTDSGKIYMIRFYVYFVCDEDENAVGIDALKIIAEDETECLVGDW